MAMLSIGTTLRGISSGAACRVRQFMGEGGQGEVYRVEFEGRMFALKWYNTTVLKIDRSLRQRLKVAIDRGAPSHKYLWPFEMVTLPDGTGCGYLMRLRKDGYCELHDLLSQTVTPRFRALATMGCLLADLLFALHAKGLVYQDLNAGNMFFDPVSGDVEICDNDNVDIDGAPSVMGGVWEFQAPEVILRNSGPTRSTDLHSLAVILFRMLHIGHPLRGRRELEFANLDQAAQRRLYAVEPRFVFDPDDESNRPLSELHGPVVGHWKIYPQFLRDLFTRAFTTGLRDPSHGRVQATEWRRAMSQLRDSVVSCPNCGVENFYDGRRVAARQPTFDCWGCHAAIRSAPPRIGLRAPGARASDAPSHIVVLEPGTQLFPHHFGNQTLNFASPVAEVMRDGLGLRNLSSRAWLAGEASAEYPVAAGASVPLTSGIRLRFGSCEGEVKL